MSLSSIRAVTLGLAVAAALAGCSTLGKATMQSAQEALSSGDVLGAVAGASDALLENPKLTSAKTLIRDNADRAIVESSAFLAASAKSASAEELERRFDAFVKLDRFYRNLTKIGLPLKEGKKLGGMIKAWEWTTTIQDYAAEIEPARDKAHDAAYAAALASLKAGDLQAADALMTKVLRKLAPANPDAVKKDGARVSKDFSDWAAKLHKSGLIEKLEQGIKAYQIALRYDAANAAAASGLKAMKTEMAAAYASKGEKQEKSGDVESLIAAHASYEQALRWDGAYAKALELRAAVKPRIAEAYYRDGQRLAADRRNKDALAKAIEAYGKALEWVEGYKDAAIARNRLRVAGELMILEGKLATTQAEFNRTQARIVALQALVAKANKGMDDLNYVADAVVQLDEQMMVLGKTASALGGIPIVGTVISVTGTALNTAHRPVNAVSEKVKRLRAPVITPAREAISGTKAQVDRIVGAMASVKTGLDYARAISLKLNECMAKVSDAAVAESIEQEVKGLGSILDDLNKGLASVNAAQDQVEGTLKAIADSVSVVSGVTGGIKSVMSPLNKIKGATDEIYDVLKKKISIPMVGSFTVEQAINSTTGVIKKAAEAVLNPVLKKLGVSIPSIPGIEQLEAIVDKLEGYYAEAKSAADKISGAADRIVSLPDKLKAKCDAIISQSGCSL